MLVLSKQAFLGGRKYDSPTKACVGGYLKAQFLHVVKKPVNFASFTDNFTLLFSKLFKLILNANTANIEQLFGPEKLSELSRNGPLALVVQTLDSAIHRINHYPAAKYYGNQLRYPLDSDLSGG